MKFEQRSLYKNCFVKHARNEFFLKLLIHVDCYLTLIILEIISTPLNFTQWNYMNFCSILDFCYHKLFQSQIDSGNNTHHLFVFAFGNVPPLENFKSHQQRDIRCQTSWNIAVEIIKRFINFMLRFKVLLFQWIFIQGIIEMEYCQPQKWIREVCCLYAKTKISVISIVS